MNNKPYSNATYAVHDGSFGDDICGVMLSYSTNCWLEAHHRGDHESCGGTTWVNDPMPVQDSYTAQTFQQFINDYVAWTNRHPEYEEMGA